MAVSPNSIITPQTPRTGAAVPTTANSNYTAPTNTVLLATGGANGGRLTKLTAIPRATVTATQLQIFSSRDSGATKTLVKTALMLAYTMSQTTEATPTDFGFSDEAPFFLAAGEELYAAIGVSVASGIAFRAEWGDY